MEKVQQQFHILGADVLTNPTWDLPNYDEDDGTRTVVVPTDITDLVDKDYEDVQNPMPEETTFPDISDILNALRNLIAGLLEAIRNLLNNIWQWLQSFWNALANALSTAFAPLIALVQAIVDTITGELDLTSKFTQYNIPTLFILILNIVLACIRLMIRVLIFAGELISIPANSGLLNSNTVAVINYIKNTNIPYVNVSFYTIVTSVVVFMFAIRTIKIIRRSFRV